MNHPFEILPLRGLVRPHVALVTTVEPVHIEFFRSIWGVADAKGEIFSGLEPGGTAVIGRDSPISSVCAPMPARRGRRVLTFGEHEASDVGASGSSSSRSLDGRGTRARPAGDVSPRHAGAAHRHELAQHRRRARAGADAAQAAMALTELQPPVGRGERTMLNAGGQALLIDESYNANPASMRAALGTLGSLEIAAGRRIAVLGDMKELGDAGPELRRGLAEAVEANRVDLVFAAGRSCGTSSTRSRAGGAAHAANSADLVDAVAAAIRPGDAVMVKGSLSTRMGLIVEALKQNFILAFKSRRRKDNSCSFLADLARISAR